MSLPLPDPPLTDGGVLLRRWRADDAEALADAWADPEIRRWMDVPGEPTPALARQWIDGDDARRAQRASLDLVIAAAADPDRVRGEVGLSHFEPHRRAALLGYWVASGERGRGLGARAVRLMVDWSLPALDLEAVVARCHTDNAASIAVVTSCGFAPVGNDADGLVVLAWRGQATSRH